MMAGRGLNQKYKYKIMTVFVLLSIIVPVYTDSQSGVSSSPEKNQVNVISASIRYSYTDPLTGKAEEYQGELGRYASKSPIIPVSGQVVHVLGEDGLNHGCTVPVNVPANVAWVALIQRGSCTFHKKVTNSAVLHNASAVVIYNNQIDDSLITMDHKIDHVVSVFIDKHDGEMLANLADSGVQVQLDISIGQITVYDIVANKRFKPSTLLAISVTLVAVLILGLVVLLILGIRKTKKDNKQANRNAVFTLRKPGQVHESLLSELDGQEHSSDHQQQGLTFAP